MPNRAPTISGTPPTTATTGLNYSFTPTASDRDGDALTFSIVNRPAWASFSSSSGRLSGTPSLSAVGQYDDIRIRVSDGLVRVVLTPFSIVVKQANRAPTIGGTPATTATTGQSYSFTPTASDPDGDALTFSIVNRPAWASFSSSSGRLSGTPGSGAIGQYDDIRIRVSDGLVRVVLTPFSIVVKQVNGAPTIGGTPATAVKTGQTYSFTPTASDPDGNTLGFSIVNRPPWASFSSSTGRLSGAPTSSSVGEHIDIGISVSDGKASASLASFSIVVSQTNRTPAINGTPPTTAREGQAYAFTPSASDADGDTLSFTIVNRPAWASFNTATGALSGTPAAGTVGTYANISIRVSDGTATASLPAFSIEVQQASMGSATLSWQPPTTRTDGSPLTNLAGYRIRYGTAQGSYPNVITIPSGGITSAVVENLPPATWYFVASAYDANGAESSNSSSVSKTIN